MKTIEIRRIQTGNAIEERFSRELSRLITRAQQSGRSVVKSALKEIRDLKNSIKRDLLRGYEIDQNVRERREDLICKRIMSGGQLL